MNILFIGDSITKGQIGSSFINIIARKRPEYNLINLGIDGETLNLITNRLLNHLKVNNGYDFIVLQGGYNDLLLPYFKTKGRAFNYVYNKQIKKGCVPQKNSNETYELLKKTIYAVKQLYTGKIIIPTLGCVSEKLSSDLNMKRNEFNQVLKIVASEMNVCLADTQKEFDSILQEKTQSDYCMDNLLSVVLWDRYWKTPDKISKKRKLFLTIDGIHLNTEGAERFANCILEKVEN